MENNIRLALDDFEMEDIKLSVPNKDIIDVPDYAIIVLAKSIVGSNEIEETCKNRMKAILKQWREGMANNVNRESRYHVKDKADLSKLIRCAVSVDLKADLNWIDVSEIKDMSCLFWNSPFNGEISDWDVSNVENMFEMFYSSEFNNDISKWNVSNVKSMQWMFLRAKFNGNISKWNISHGAKTDGIFLDCSIDDSFKPIIK